LRFVTEFLTLLFEGDEILGYVKDENEGILNVRGKRGNMLETAYY